MPGLDCSLILHIAAATESLRTSNKSILKWQTDLWPRIWKQCDPRTLYCWEHLSKRTAFQRDLPESTNTSSHRKKIRASQLFSPLATFLARQPPRLRGPSPKCQSKSQTDVKMCKQTSFYSWAAGLQAEVTGCIFSHFISPGLLFFFFDGRTVFHKRRTSG